MKYNRATIPQRVIDLLFSDDGFYNEVVASKKVVVNKYPRSDQWVDESGLNISFALAGYSGSDIKISFNSTSIVVENVSKIEESNAMQKGLISRGIAKRNFVETIYVHRNFDTSKCSASMENGLLHINIPNSEDTSSQEVTIR